VAARASADVPLLATPNWSEDMARYYFDLHFGDIVYNDEEGKVLKRPTEAFKQMAETLAEVGREMVAKPGQPAVVGVVRDDTGVLWRGRLSLEVQRFQPSERRVA
jgi:hypothetical protein